MNSQFDHVEILRKTESYPTHLSDGVSVFSGKQNNCVDKNLSNGVTYFYTAFAVYKNGQTGKITDESQGHVTPHTVSIYSHPDPFIDSVVSFTPLNPLSVFGGWNMPNIVLGAPMGGGNFAGSLDAVSLHAKVSEKPGAPGIYGGSIVLEFTDNIVVNQNGPDFTIFENAFRMGGTDGYWMEPATVEVSVDGIQFYRFPFDYVPHYNEDNSINLYHPFSYAKGFAGVKPVYSKNGSPDPTNPLVSGGDQFDLSDLSQKLSWIRYIRITSTGDNWLRDMNGDYVRHTNEAPSWGANGSGNSGFDLDAVSAINY